MIGQNLAGLIERESISTPSWERAATIAAWVAFVCIVLVVAVRLPLLIRTLLYDRQLVLGEEALHVPVVRAFQLRAWNITVRDIATLIDRRTSGGSTEIVIALHAAPPHVFSAAVLVDRYAVMSAIERRLGPNDQPRDISSTR